MLAMHSAVETMRASIGDCPTMEAAHAPGGHIRWRLEVVWGCLARVWGPFRAVQVGSEGPSS